MDRQANQPEEIPLAGFLDELANIHRNIDDRAIAFALGAGASVSSGVSSGTQPVKQWLELLRNRRATNKPDLNV